MAGVSIHVRFNHLGDVVDELKGGVADIKDKFLSDVDAFATASAPVRTGNLKNNRTRDEDSVHWHADYAAYVNSGTRYMAAQPFVSNAVERALPGAQSALDQLAGRLGE
jgi:Bacteriophage protein of unknown function (DUF646).